jgi:signal peptidase I
VHRAPGSIVYNGGVEPISLAEPVRTGKGSTSNAIRDVLETLILTALIFLLVRSVTQNFKVEGRSMEPTLQNGQYLLINKATYWRVDNRIVSRINPSAEASTNGQAAAGYSYLFGPPQRGDIIVFRYPLDPSRDFIKRVIGVPGDIVEIRSGAVYLNGQPMVEGYTADRPAYSKAAERVPPREYYVLGDNRNNSSDSHNWGLVPEENIIGRAWFSYLPIELLGPVPDSRPAATGAR